MRLVFTIVAAAAAVPAGVMGTLHVVVSFRFYDELALNQRMAIGLAVMAVVGALVGAASYGMGREVADE